MKHFLFLFFVTFLLCSNITHAQNISATLPLTGTFVEGISPVRNTFTYPNPNNNALKFVIKNGAGVVITADSTTTNNVLTLQDFDMGRLNPNASIEVMDSVNNVLANARFNVIARPLWLSSGRANNVVVSDSFIDLDAVLPLQSPASNVMPSGVPGLTNRPYGLINPNLSIHIKYNINRSASTSALSNPTCNFTLNVFDQVTVPYTNQLQGQNGLVLDSAFNLAVNVNGTYNSRPFSITFPSFRLPTPIPGITVKVDGGVSFNATLYGQLIFGYNAASNSWGFIELAGEKTKVTAKINGEGFVRVSADALIASVSGSLIARGSIGGGFTYVSVPATEINPLFGLQLEIAGALDYKLGIGWFSKTGRLERTFYSNTWGNQLRMPHAYQTIVDEVDALGNYTKTVKNNPAFEVPNYFAQPAFSGDTSNLYIVWLDYDSNEQQKILFSQLDYRTGNFSRPVEVINNKDIITNPKIAVMPSGSALITWTESRYNRNNFDSTTQNLNNILKAQDVWATIYNKSTASFLPPFRFSDYNTSTMESGQADGQANIIMGKGNYGLITWVGADLAADSSDIYYCTVTESGSTWSFGSPQRLVNMSGTNRNVVVSYYDDIHAIASWINDPDGEDSTLNNQVVYREWDGTTWGATQVLIASDSASSFDDLSMDFNQDFGAIAYTSTHYLPNGRLQKRITASVWNPVTDTWAVPFMDDDTAYYFAKPRVAVSKDGYTSLTYQAIELYSDTISPDQGILYMLLNKATNPNTWVLNRDSTTIGDPNVYVSDIQTAFDKAGNLFAITQESDTLTGQAPMNPINGVRFGNNHLNLVLRSFALDNNLNLSGTTEPGVNSTITDIESYEIPISSISIYPNPISTSTTINYSLSTDALVKIQISDFLGKTIATLFDGNLSGGSYTTVFEPSNLPNGIYFCTIIVNGKPITKKLMIAK